MNTPYLKAQTITVNQQGRTATFNDDRYFVRFEIPCDYHQREIKVSGIDIKSNKVVGAYLTNKQLVGLIDDAKDRSRRAGGNCDFGFTLPSRMGVIMLDKKDLAILEIALNEPDDEIMAELVKKLEAV